MSVFDSLLAVLVHHYSSSPQGQGVMVSPSQHSPFSSEIQTPENMTRRERNTDTVVYKSRKIPASDLQPTRFPSSVETDMSGTLTAVATHVEPIGVALAQAAEVRTSPHSTAITLASHEPEPLVRKTSIEAKVELEDQDSGFTTTVGRSSQRSSAAIASSKKTRRPASPPSPYKWSKGTGQVLKKLSLSDQNSHLVDLPINPPATSGGFCELYVGSYRPTGLKLAMKRPKTLFPNEDTLRRFRREAEIWSALEHANIVPFYGILEIRQSLYLVSPWMALGDLLEFSRTRSQFIKEGKLNAQISHESVPPAYSHFNEPRIVREIASGMDYLHSSAIVHGDMKAKNVLLDAQCCAKICDFGLTKTLDHSVTSTGSLGAGSARWQSPELFENTPKSSQSDVYAFAFTIVEVLTGEHPFPHLKEAIAIMRAVMDRHERPAFEPISQLGVDFRQLWEIAAQCWPPKPGDRLTMTEVLQQLGPLGANS